MFAAQPGISYVPAISTKELMSVLENSQARLLASQESVLQRTFTNLASQPNGVDEALPLVVNPDHRTNRLVDEKTAADMMSCSVALLRKWRSRGGGPTVVRIGRLVRYQQTDLLAFIEAKKERVA